VKALAVLADGDLEVKGRMPWSSNNTFLVESSLNGAVLPAVYKPGRGERPLWDFPGNLYRREVAAYLVSEALGWGIVPETVIRDGPFGEGSVQRFVDADFSEHYFTLLEREECHDALRRICAFDFVINNADRKGGHCLLGEDGRIWAIDHGLGFHEAPKLRTVIWEFAGQRLPDDVTADIAALAESPPAGLEPLLDPDEIEALCVRARRLARHPELPEPDAHTHYPWPMV
jgi:uncharacterized repeat protein (TIGR03843 family)